jgi:hypothetical protein
MSLTLFCLDPFSWTKQGPLFRPLSINPMLSAYINTHQGTPPAHTVPIRRLYTLADIARVGG